MFNPQQLAAVEASESHNLILAGAGSGKTTVLVARMQWLLQSGKVQPQELLAVTFTNKAAKEMLSRLDATLPFTVRRMWVGTFHGLCNRMLRTHYQLTQLPATFQILDMSDQLSGIKRVMKAQSVDFDLLAPKEAQWYINSCKEEGLRAGDVDQSQGNKLLMLKQQVYAAYQQQCDREGVVDFAELLLRSYELLQNYPHIQKHYSRRFKHILVDEFQDTNQLQYKWLKLLAAYRQLDIEDKPWVFAVGDDDQSIYSFRGARVSNMHDFLHEFEVQEPIRLEQNYRSFGHILHTANALISGNEGRLGKNLFTEAGDGDTVKLAELSDDQQEAEFVLDTLKELMGDASGLEQKLAADQIAILYRSNAQSRTLENALFHAGIPYKVYGGLRYFDRAEVKHALAYLRLLDNPDDDTSFLRVVNFPPRGIGARSVEQLQALATQKNTSLWNAVEATAGALNKKFTLFKDLVQKMRSQNEHSNLPELMDYAIEHSGLLAHYESKRDGADRVENLRELVTAAERFLQFERLDVDSRAFGAEDTPTKVASDAEAPLLLDASGAENLASELPASTDINTNLIVVDGEVLPQSPLSAFLTNASLEAGETQRGEGEAAVQLMTVHSSKGLEFDCVFITGLEEGLFPHENALSDYQGVEEERRLMYVAITRARQKLFITMTQMRMLHGKTRYNIRSRFVDELPEEHIQWLSAQPGRFADWGERSGSHTSSRTSGLGYEDTSSSSDSLENAFTHAEVEAEWHVGDGVFHSKFGEGNVLAVKGSGDDTQVQVFFKRHGKKLLVASIAKLVKTT